jgi:hypothetical protein
MWSEQEFWAKRFTGQTPYRLQSEDCFYHITSRGNDRKKVFLNDTDFEKFLEYILTQRGCRNRAGYNNRGGGEKIQEESGGFDK